jgi:DNA-directed RNA polymerase specialized sigma24 family protein
MAALADCARTAALQAKVAYMARVRYGIRPGDAPDIFHEAVATYLTVHGRYPPSDNHFGILVGIFHLKALEHIASRQRTDRVATRLVSHLRADRPDVARGEDPKGTVTDRIVRDEDATLIRKAIGSLAPDAREMLLALAEGRASRLELIEKHGLNRNTFDTRLRAIRLRLKKALESTGVL